MNATEKVGEPLAKRPRKDRTPAASNETLSNDQPVNRKLRVSASTQPAVDVATQTVASVDAPTAAHACATPTAVCDIDASTVACNDIAAAPVQTTVGTLAASENPLGIFEAIALRTDAILALDELFPPSARDARTRAEIDRLLDSPTLSESISHIIAVNVLRSQSRSGVMANLIPIVDGVVSVMGPLLGPTRHAAISQTWDESKVHLKSNAEYTQRFFNRVKTMTMAELNDTIASASTGDNRQVIALGIVLLRIAVSALNQDSTDE